MSSDDGNDQIGDKKHENGQSVADAAHIFHPPPPKPSAASVSLNENALRKQEGNGSTGSSLYAFDGDESRDDGSLWGDLDDNPGKGSELDREWKNRRDQFYNHGYREGISTGQNDSAQEGFNNGFKDSVLDGYNWGLVRGITSALAYLPEELRTKMVETEDKRREFKSLHESVRSISTESALKAFYVDMNEKKALGEFVENESDEISESTVLESHFQKLQLLVQNSPELEVGLERRKRRNHNDVM